MTQARWTAVDNYFNGLLVGPDEALDAAVEASGAAGLPEIQVAPNQGKLLNMLARLQGARTILEIGTLGGYSTIWLARALPEGGRLVTLEADPAYAEVARANIARAGLADVVEVRVGPALETLPVLAAEGYGPFDVVFIDADKPSNPDYLAWSVRLTRPRQPDHRRQRRTRRRGRRRRQHRPEGAGGAPVHRTRRRRPGPERHRAPDRGGQGI
ncbi:putative O-methyltransferase YrrM [Streptomyces sp. TE33382]